MDETHAKETGRFDIAEIAAAFPDTAKTLLLDRYLTDTHAGERARVPRL
jgi:hypothetical protein